MKVLLLNGSPHEKGCTYTALAEAAGELERCGDKLAQARTMAEVDAALSNSRRRAAWAARGAGKSGNAYLRKTLSTL